MLLLLTNKLKAGLWVSLYQNLALMFVINFIKTPPEFLDLKHADGADKQI
jgi:hypothetical protein